jgi:hypothetical protein
MNFVKFDGQPKCYKTSPFKMVVGQVCTRRRASRSMIYRLHREMRQCMLRGREFSVSYDDGAFTIRRDK